MNRVLCVNVGLAAALAAGCVCDNRSGQEGSPLVFTGEAKCGTYLTAPAGGEQTFSCWFKATGNGEGNMPYDRIVNGKEWYLHTMAGVDSVDSLTFGYIGASGKLNSLGSMAQLEGIVFGAWQHIAVTFKAGDAFRIYLNGVELADAKGASGIRDDLPKALKGGLFCLGNVSPGANRPFKGEIAAACFRDRALSAAEIAALAEIDPDGKPIQLPASRKVTEDDFLPVADISDDVANQVVIAEGTKDRYEGHPTTLLADDGKTLFCVWTTGHGGPCGQMARSDDGGKTWTRLDSTLPAVYARTHRNCPVLQKVHGSDGKTRYFIYSCKAKEGRGLGIMMSEDLGKTWVELPCQPQLVSGMPPTGLMELKDGTVALFGQLFKDRKRAKDRPSDDQAVWMAVSKDGGRTYGEMRVVMKADRRNLCEPFCIRSPDGKSLVLLARDNRHKGRSMMCFSHDEGKTWTTPVDTPWALTGDRHEGVLLPDGRYLIAFRDQALTSPTRGQYMGWVGTFDDLINGRNGEYRIHIQHHHGLVNCFPGGTWDTGYSGVELLKDGTLVCTTYSRHFADERQSSVVAARFRIEDTDKLVK